MNSLALVRWTLLLLMAAKQVLFYVWIFPSWWLAHSKAYEMITQQCQDKESAEVDCEVQTRILHPLNAPRTLLVYELVAKILFIVLAKSMSAHWKNKFAYSNRLRLFEFLLGGVVLISMIFWMFILRAHEEIRAAVPGFRILPAAAYFQKWISPWIDILYLLVLWVYWSMDLFPV